MYVLSVNMDSLAHTAFDKWLGKKRRKGGRGEGGKEGGREGGREV